MGKEVGHPLLPGTRVMTKVEFFLSQLPVSSSTQGSLGSFDFTPQSPLGPSGRTCSKQKIIGDSVERERKRRARPLSFFFLLFCSSLLLLLQCSSFSLLTDE